MTSDVITIVQSYDEESDNSILNGDNTAFIIVYFIVLSFHRLHDKAQQFFTLYEKHFVVMNNLGCNTTRFVLYERYPFKKCFRYGSII